MTGLQALSDAEWLGEALSARPELDASAYFSLTGRLETLELLLELLAHRCAEEGREPREYRVRRLCLTARGALHRRQQPLKSM